MPPRPTQIKLKTAESKLNVTFDDGSEFSFPTELLRVESPSAEVMGHGADQKKIIAGRRHVGVMEIEPVGNYAIRLIFDDLHDTGIFSWQYLYELGMTQDQRWQDYLRALKQAGFSRDP